MDAEARKIRRFINNSLISAHDRARHIVPNLLDFKKRIKKDVKSIDFGTNSKGEKMITISMGRGGRIKVEIISSGVEEEKARTQLRDLMLEIVLDAKKN